MTSQPDPRQQSGRILHLQRLSTEDGPGIRTTVFFKGCPLRCDWCHNPESISPYPQIQWLETRCIDCQTCLDACPNGCLTMTPAGLAIDRQRCRGCGTCAEACPANALELLGATITVEELVGEVCKDRAYYEASAGGVTASGGEPLAQPEFVAAFLARLQKVGISTALDTCGIASPRNLAKVLPHVDLVLFDLKEVDPDRHKVFTGQRNDLVFEALHFIQGYIRSRQPQTHLWIRTPLIPGTTATEENIRGLGAYISQVLDGLPERWELCAFNNLCRDKYRRLGIDWTYKDVPLLSEEELSAFETCARQSGVDPDIVIATGATRNAGDGHG